MLHSASCGSLGAPRPWPLSPVAAEMCAEPGGSLGPRNGRGGVPARGEYGAEIQKRRGDERKSEKDAKTVK